MFSVIQVNRIYLIFNPVHFLVDSSVQLLGRERIRWDALDVDLSLSIIANPDKYPLVSK